MSKIKVMSQALSNQIAAGEVIERPASVVKELVENALDAGADFIDVAVERAGSRLISVSDNGCGMDDEDVLLCLEPHGTSKLLAEEDLAHIMTLGFRGEALPSIASVSRFTIQTRTAETAEGTQLESDCGTPPRLSPCACPVGTRIEVRELFHNVPARKKFLKSAATEEHHIEELLALLAIGHPEVGFRLQMDGRTAFHTPAVQDLRLRLVKLFGKSFVEKMLFLEHQENGIHISGCIGAPGFTRPSRRDQRVFINSRAVEAPAVFRGIREGYSTLAEPGRYNPVILFLEMAPDELDVNVHPAKREVRFRTEYAVSRAVAAAVSAALRKMRSPETLPESAENLPLSGKLPLSMVLDAAEVRYHCSEKTQMELPAPEKGPSVSPVSAWPEDPFSPATAGETPPSCADLPEGPASPPPVVPAATEAAAAPEECEEEVPPPLQMRETVSNNAAFSGIWPTKILGALDRTYILGEAPNGLVLIDQHAAHERIQFEAILEECRKGSAVQQKLLLPETVELPRAMASLLLKNSVIFEQLGFDVESAGGCTVLINSLPLTLASRHDIGTMFLEMLEELMENAGNRLPVELEYVARAACKAAVKAHEELSLREMEDLVEKLSRCRQGTLCPHGRPTLIAIPFSEIEKRFYRK